MIREETIAAIATPHGAGGVGIVRLSGVRAVEIVARLCGGVELEDRRMTHARCGIPRSEALDAVLAVVMRAPRSYTGEDMAELHGHGGAVNTQVRIPPSRRVAEGVPSRLAKGPACFFQLLAGRTKLIPRGWKLTVEPDLGQP